MNEYHYIQSEPGLWTVGTGTPKSQGGKDWEPESDHDSPEKAAQRVRWLNGGDTLSPTTHEVLKGKDEEIARLRGLLEMFLKYNDDYGLSGTDMRRMMDNIWIPKVRAELENK